MERINLPCWINHTVMQIFLPYWCGTTNLLSKINPIFSRYILHDVLFWAGCDRIFPYLPRISVSSFRVINTIRLCESTGNKVAPPNSRVHLSIWVLPQGPRFSFFSPPSRALPSPLIFSLHRITRCAAKNYNVQRARARSNSEALYRVLTSPRGANIKRDIDDGRGQFGTETKWEQKRKNKKQSWMKKKTPTRTAWEFRARAKCFMDAVPFFRFNLYFFLFLHGGHAVSAWKVEHEHVLVYMCYRFLGRGCSSVLLLLLLSSSSCPASQLFLRFAFPSLLFAPLFVRFSAVFPPFRDVPGRARIFHTNWYRSRARARLAINEIAWTLLAAGSNAEEQAARARYFRGYAFSATIFHLVCRAKDVSRDLTWLGVSSGCDGNAQKPEGWAKRRRHVIIHGDTHGKHCRIRESSTVIVVYIARILPIPKRW